MSIKKHILLISPQPFFEARGTPINVREMLYTLSDGDYQVTLLTYPFGEELHIPNVNIIRSPKIPFLKSVKVGPSIGKIFLDILLSLKALLLSFKVSFDSFHGIEEAGLLVGALGLIHRKPFIVDVDSAMSQQLEESGFIKSRLILGTFEKVEAFFFSNARAVITVCEALSKEVLRLSPNSKIYQIEDFPLDENVDENIFKINIREKFQIPENKNIILYAGNFESYQGVDLLVKSFAELIKLGNTNSQLVLVGGIDAHIKLTKDLAESLSVLQHITFTGQLDPKYMKQVHEQANLLVSPRLKGTNTPLKIYSYMNSGIPILATNIYSHTQVLTENSAFLAAPDISEFRKNFVPRSFR